MGVDFGSIGTNKMRELFRLRARGVYRFAIEKIVNSTHAPVWDAAPVMDDHSAKPDGYPSRFLLVSVAKSGMKALYLLVLVQVNQNRGVFIGVCLG